MARRCSCGRTTPASASTRQPCSTTESLADSARRIEQGKGAAGECLDDGRADLSRGRRPIALSNENDAHATQVVAVDKCVVAVGKKKGSASQYPLSQRRFLATTLLPLHPASRRTTRMVASPALLIHQCLGLLGASVYRPRGFSSLSIRWLRSTFLCRRAERRPEFRRGLLPDQRRGRGDHRAPRGRGEGPQAAADHGERLRRVGGEPRRHAGPAGAHFEPYIPSIEWAANILDVVERSRNVIMHSGRLDRPDIERVDIFIRDWVKQVGA